MNIVVDAVPIIFSPANAAHDITEFTAYQRKRAQMLAKNSVIYVDQADSICQNPGGALNSPVPASGPCRNVIIEQKNPVADRDFVAGAIESSHRQLWRDPLMLQMQRRLW